MSNLTNTQVIAECRKEAKKHGMTFKKCERLTINGGAAYKYVVRGTDEQVRINLTLGLAYNIACSGELANYDLQ